jgi:hypothetical protein
MIRTLLGAAFIVALGSLAWCLVLGGLLGDHHVIAVELSALSLGGLWAGLTIRELATWQRMAVALGADAEDVVLFGVPCRLTSGIGTDALVLGPIRPRIFVGRSLVHALSEDELRAVVYHEDHHRRTWAPARAAALAAWLHLLGRSSRIRTVVLHRLSHLEVLADVDAIRRGTTPGSLARALLKGDPGPQPISFSFAADERVERLLDRAAGTAVDAPDRLPFEWLPAALLAIGTLACHAII